MFACDITYLPCSFADMAGWCDDDCRSALGAYSKSEAILRERFPALAPLPNSPEDARRFFEAHFVPHRIVHAASNGLFTGYYEPVLRGSRDRSERFHTPLLRRPPDLINAVPDDRRGSVGDALTAGRAGAGGELEPYLTRAEIVAGGLAGRGLEIVYLDDEVDAYFLHVQGSGLVELDEGERIRVGFAGKNGYPYTSIGAALIAEGNATAEEMSLDFLAGWLRADPLRGRAMMARNRSYIFFEELGPADQAAPLGVKRIPLTPGRSLAVDTSVHEIGLPIHVTVPGLADPDSNSGRMFQRLMIAQDVGSAIRGAERGDIFFGTGSRAGQLAGTTKHRGNMIVLLPKVVADR